MAMSSSRPYMIRALYDWIVDNSCTPYIVVDAHGPGVEVPQSFVNKDGQIILNIAPGAIAGLDLGQDAVAFNARFGGVPTDIYVPCLCVMGIYARGNGQGMVFEPEAYPEPPKPDRASDRPATPITSAKPGKKPSLKVVK